MEYLGSLVDTRVSHQVQQERTGSGEDRGGPGRTGEDREREDLRERGGSGEPRRVKEDQRGQGRAGRPGRARGTKEDQGESEWIEED